MAASCGVKTQDLSKVQQTVIFIHAANLESGLQCVSRNGETISFPENWSEDKEGVYKFNYKVKDSTSKEGNSKVVQFRLINNGQSDGSISVNYSV